MIREPGTVLVLAGVLIIGYSYFGYPALLWLFSLGRRARTPAPPSDWPQITITVPAYNEERSIATTIDALLATDYPSERRRILVVSDASTDRTDDIVRGYAGQGVDLLRLEKRSGKTGAENAARELLRGGIVVNTDASVRIDPRSLKPLVTALQDPGVGVASSRDVSVAHLDRQENVGEAGYVGYEMWVRRLETRLEGIVGASGSLYAIRADLHRELLPAALSRDFSAALVARAHGLRAVSVEEAVCYVPRGRTLRSEYRRKVRTMTRGLETLWHWRPLLNPFRYGVFSWMLFSHKLVRWMVPWAALLILAGLAGLTDHPEAAVLLALGGVGVLLGAAGWLFPRASDGFRVFSIPAYILSGTVAGLHAWVRAVTGELNPIWEPTRR